MDLGDEAPRGLIDYPNMPRTLGIVISAGKATLHELETVYGIEDVYDMLEIIMVDAHNQRILNKKQEG
mgnify:CR=1 FL=1